MNIKIFKSDKPLKKFYALFPDGKKVYFGASGYSDYTKHKDDDRKDRYIARHSKMGEDWNKSGIETAGFLSRWFLWNKKTLRESARDIEKRFNVKVTLSLS